VVCDVEHKEYRDRKLKPEEMFRMVEVIAVLVLASLWPVIYYSSLHHHHHHHCYSSTTIEVMPLPLSVSPVAG